MLRTWLGLLLVAAATPVALHARKRMRFVRRWQHWISVPFPQGAEAQLTPFFAFLARDYAEGFSISS